MAIAGIVLGWAGVAIGVIIAVVFVTVGGFSSGSDRLPNPEHVVAGRSITLPRTLHPGDAARLVRFGDAGPGTPSGNDPVVPGDPC